VPRAFHIAAAAAALVAAAGPAGACRVQRSPEQRLASAYKLGLISGVALVRITRSDYIRPRLGKARPWEADGDVERLLGGSYLGRSVSFRRGSGSAACDDGLPPPRRGELWVVYIGKGATTDRPVRHSYPLGIALAADPRLRRTPR
jgi:hypothetical protein